MFKLTPVKHNPFSPKSGHASPSDGDDIRQQMMALLGQDQAVRSEVQHEEPKGDLQWKRKLHVVSTFDPSEQAAKIHGVFASDRHAEKVHRALVKKAYREYREEQYAGTVRPTTYKIAMDRMNANRYAYPTLQSIPAEMDASPEDIALVHEGIGPEGVSPFLQIHAAGNAANGAKAIAEHHAREFWNSGNQSTPDELNSRTMRRLKMEWNAEHKEHAVDRDFDFEDETSVPSHLKEERMRRFMAEMDRPEEFPGLRRANAHQKTSDHLHDKGRTGVFNVTHHRVIMPDETV